VGQPEAVVNAKLDATNLVVILAKRHRNSVCVVSVLPELLSNVFSINFLCDHPGSRDGKYSLGWISATYVCHQWCEVGHPARLQYAYALV
jgi:hypothetical protein